MTSSNQQFIESVIHEINEDRLLFVDVIDKYPIINEAFDTISTLNMLLKKLHGVLLEPGSALIKSDNQSVSSQNPSKRTVRNPYTDRVFPLNTVDIQQFRLKHEADIEKATIHTGPYANELARSFNALALTIGTDIYFRDKAYNPESEEGHKVIAHELTHIAQYEEGKLSENNSREKLEEEARLAENKEILVNDTIVTLNLNGKRYKFPKSKMKYYAQKTARKIKEWLYEEKFLLTEKEYLRLLVSFEEWLGAV